MNSIEPADREALIATLKKLYPSVPQSPVSFCRIPGRVQDVENGRTINKKKSCCYWFNRIVWSLLVLTIGGLAIYVVKTYLDAEGYNYKVKVSSNNTIHIFRRQVYSVEGEEEISTKATNYSLLEDGRVKIEFELRSQAIQFFQDDANRILYVKNAVANFTIDNESSEFEKLEAPCILQTSFEFVKNYKSTVNLFNGELPSRVDAQYAIAVGATEQGPFNIILFNRTFHLKTESGFWKDLYKLNTKKGKGRQSIL